MVLKLKMVRRCIRLMCLTPVCEVTWHRLVQVRQKFNKQKWILLSCRAKLNRCHQNNCVPPFFSTLRCIGGKMRTDGQAMLFWCLENCCKKQHNLLWMLLGIHGTQLWGKNDIDCFRVKTVPPFTLITDLVKVLYLWLTSHWFSAVFKWNLHSKVSMSKMPLSLYSKISPFQLNK